MWKMTRACTPPREYNNCSSCRVELPTNLEKESYLESKQKNLFADRELYVNRNIDNCENMITCTNIKFVSDATNNENHAMITTNAEHEDEVSHVHHDKEVNNNNDLKSNVDVHEIEEESEQSSFKSCIDNNIRNNVLQYNLNKINIDNLCNSETSILSITNYESNIAGYVNDENEEQYSKKNKLSWHEEDCLLQEPEKLLYELQEEREEQEEEEEEKEEQQCGMKSLCEQEQLSVSLEPQRERANCEQEMEQSETINAHMSTTHQQECVKSPSCDYTLHRFSGSTLENADRESDCTSEIYETPYLQRTETRYFSEDNNTVWPTLVPSLLYTPQVDPERLSLRAALDIELDLINEAYKFTMLDPITTLIENELYIGGFPENNLLPQLRSMEIKHIINCCSCDFVCDATFKREFNVIELPCYDESDYLILHRHYEEFKEILMELMERCHERVFVHCIAGVNRSVTLCAAYLIDRLCITPIEAVRIFRSHGRMHILDNVEFRHQIIDHYLQSRETANMLTAIRLSMEREPK